MEMTSAESQNMLAYICTLYADCAVVMAAQHLNTGGQLALPVNASPACHSPMLAIHLAHLFLGRALYRFMPRTC